MSAASGRAVLMGAAALPVTAEFAAASPPHPDAELIRLCDAYLSAVAAYNASGGELEYEEDPLWLAIDHIREQLNEMAPETIDGVLAEARVAAWLAVQLDGSEDFSDSFTGDWPERVVRHLLRLNVAGMLPANVEPGHIAGAAG